MAEHGGQESYMYEWTFVGVVKGTKGEGRGKGVEAVMKGQGEEAVIKGMRGEGRGRRQ